MITKEVLQNFVNHHLDDIVEILPGGLKDKNGKWLLVCPVMERFDLDFSKVKALQPVVEQEAEVVEKPKKSRSKKKK